MESENVETLIRFFLQNYDHFEKYANGGIISRIGFNIYNRFIKRNSKAGSRKNIHAHYDVGNDFYKLWLDPSMTYSSALFKDEGLPLQDAQHAKYGRIMERIGNKAASLLEIGCGWGGFAEEASKKIQDITCLTISKQQQDYAVQRLKDRAKILLKDYRDMHGKFDAIVSIRNV